MSNFKQATRERLRFETSKGLLSTEQLWDLNLTSLATIVRSLKKQLKKDNDDELSFLDDTSNPVDKTLELKFNVVKEVYIAKKEEMESIRNEASKKEHNQKILELIAEKQEGDLRGKSIEELTAMLKE
jgi:hypothetical protein